MNSTSFQKHIEDFYSILDLDPSHQPTIQKDTLLSKLISKNSSNQILIKRYIKRHSMRVLEKQKCSSLMLCKHKQDIAKPRRQTINKLESTAPQQQQQQQQPLQIGKPEILFSEPRNQPKDQSSCPCPLQPQPQPQSLFQNRKRSSKAIPNVQLGFVDISVTLNTLQKNSRFTKAYFEVLRKYNRNGRRIQIHLEDGVGVEMEKVRQSFRRSSSLMIIKSQALLPRIRKIR